MADRGRPTKRTPEVEGIILGAIESGSSNYGAAGMADIDARTLQRWIEADDDFCREVARARAKAFSSAEQRLHKNNPESWVSRGPGNRHAPKDEKWVDSSKIEFTGKLGVGPSLDTDQLTTAELEQLLELHKKAQPKQLGDGSGA